MSLYRLQPSSPICLLMGWVLDQQQLYMQEQQQKYRQKSPKRIIINIDYNYPFQLVLPPISPAPTLKIARTFSKSQISRNKHLSQKISFIQKLRNKNLIKIEQISENKDNIQINYEYIKNILQINKYDLMFWNLIEKQLENFITYLANIGVKCQILRERMGVTTEGVFKYYLGIEFQIDQQSQYEDLQAYYRLLLKKIRNTYTPQQKQSQIVPYKKQNTIAPTVSLSKQQKNRKQSLLTLQPQKMPKFYTKMKNIVQEMNNYRYALINGNGNAGSLQKYHSNVNFNSGGTKKIGKEIMRKLSENGDIFKKQRKESTKYSDYKSQYVNNNREKSVREQIITKYEKIQSNKSRVQQLKVQEYTQITKKNKKYLQDFLSVLEDDIALQQSQNQKIDITLQSSTPSPNPGRTHPSGSSFPKKREREPSIQLQFERSQNQLQKSKEQSKSKSKSNQKSSKVYRYQNQNINHNLNKGIKHENNQLVLYECEVSQMENQTQTQVLKSKAQQSIQNSLRLIRKVKGLY